MWAQNDISITLARTHDLEFMLTLSLLWKDRWHLIQSKVSQNRVNPLTFWNRDESVNSYQISTQCQVALTFQSCTNISSFIFTLLLNDGLQQQIFLLHKFCAFQAKVEHRPEYLMCLTCSGSVFQQRTADGPQVHAVYVFSALQKTHGNRRIGKRLQTIRKVKKKAGQILVSHLQWQNSPEAHKELLSPKYADNQLQCLQPTLKWY